MEMFFCLIYSKIISYNFILYIISFLLANLQQAFLTNITNLLIFFSMYLFVSSEFDVIFSTMDGYHSWHMLS